MTAREKRTEAAKALRVGIDLTVESMDLSEQETGRIYSVVSHVLENGTLVIVARGPIAERIEGEMLRSGLCKPLRRGEAV